MAIKTFTSGEVLTASDTNTYLANSGLVYVKSQTIGNAVTSVQVTNAFSSTYDDYLVLISGGAGTQNDSIFTMTLGATNTGYYFALIYSSYGSGTVSTAGSANVSNFNYLGGSHTDGLRANITIQSPFLSKPTGVSAPVSNRINWGGNTTGYLNNTTSYTDFTLGVTSGTITGGTITVYGYRKA